MVQQADIVRLKGSTGRLGIVDKVVMHEGKEVAILRWLDSNDQRVYLDPSRLETLRTRQEALQRGRKKYVPGLQED